VTHSHRISTLGILVADAVARPVDEAPSGNTLQLVDEIAIEVGGSALNTACCLRRWGQRVAVFGKVGGDALGDWLLASMDEHGIDRTGVIRSPDEATSASLVLVDSKAERAFIHSMGANGTLATGELDLDRLLEADALHVAGALVLPELDGEPMAELLARACDAGLLTSLDTTFDPAGRWERVHPCLPYCDVLAPGIEEARGITGEIHPEDVAAALLERGVGRVALTMGEQGSWVADRHESFHTPAFPVSAVDGTGAGDAFAAAFLLGTLRGWPLQRTADVASSAGALATTRVGATAGVFDLSHTIGFAAGGTTS
jgi:sugar/nucleoside kinase (ribokinase family)